MGRNGAYHYACFFCSSAYIFCNLKGTHLLNAIKPVSVIFEKIEVFWSKEMSYLKQTAHFTKKCNLFCLQLLKPVFNKITRRDGIKKNKLQWRTMISYWSLKEDLLTGTILINSHLTRQSLNASFRTKYPSYRSVNEDGLGNTCIIHKTF